MISRSQVDGILHNGPRDDRGGRYGSDPREIPLTIGRIRFMRTLLRRSIDALPAPMPVWVQGTFRYLRHPRVRERRRLHRRVMARLDPPSRVSQGPFRGMRYVAL